MLRPVLIASVVALAGCVSPAPPPPDPTTIQARDRSAVQPGARISANFVREREAPANAQGGHGIEFNAMRTRGEDTQPIAARSQPVVFGANTFTAPVELRHEFDVAFYDVSYRWRRYFGASRAFGIEALAGLGAADVDMRVSSAARSAREALDSVGFFGGLGVIWRPRPSSALGSRLGLYASGGDGITNGVRLEFYVGQALGSNVALRAGYSFWHLETDRDFRQSDVKINFAGPTLALDLAF